MMLLKLPLVILLYCWIYCTNCNVERIHSTSDFTEKNERVSRDAPYSSHSNPYGYQQPNYNYNPVAPSPPSVSAQSSQTSFLPAVYNGCGETKGCFGLFESTCVAQGSCSALVTYAAKGSSYEFELWAPNAQPEGSYVAFGLSNDNKMGDDSITECTVVDGRANAYMSYNEGKSNSRLSNPTNGLRVLEARYIDGNLYCRVEREQFVSIKGNTFDLKQNFYILLARGSASAGGVRYHDRQKTASKRSIALDELSSVGSNAGSGVKFHGGLMVLAWIFSASCGILFPRYFKLTWVGKQLMGMDWWFAFHRGFMMITWSFTILAFIIIFVELGGWTSVPTATNPHALIGLITTLLVFIQPIMAYFRPHPDNPKRYIFNWAHWFAGSSAHVLGTACVFLAVDLTKAAIPRSVTWLVTIFVVINVFTHLTLTFAQRYFVQESTETEDVGNLSYQNNQSQITLPQLTKKEDAPGSSLRQKILFLYMLLVGIFTVSIVSIIATGPWIS